MASLAELWAQQQLRNPSGYYMANTEAPLLIDAATGKAADMGPEGFGPAQRQQEGGGWDYDPGQTMEQVLYGGFINQKNYIDKMLANVAQQAGLPANFDWKPYQAAAAQKGAVTKYSGFQNHLIPVLMAGQEAQKDYPQLQQILPQYAAGSPEWNAAEQRAAKVRDESKEQGKVELGVMAAVGGFFGAAALAAGTAGTAAAGGSASGAGAAGVGESVSGAYGATAGELGAAGASYGTGAAGAAGGVGAAGAGGGAGGATVTPAATGTAGTTGTMGAGALGSGITATPSTTASLAAPIGTTAAAGAGGSTAATTAAGVAGSTALSRILDGKASTADYASVLGNVGMAAYGAYASDKQTDAYKELADKYMAMGAPYRSELAAISEDPNKFYQGPAAQQGLEAVLRRLSVNGNPAGSPYSQSLALGSLYDKYGAERDRLAGFGGLTAYNQAAPGAATNAIGSQANTYNAIGAGAADLFGARKQRSLADILREGGY